MEREENFGGRGMRRMTDGEKILDFISKDVQSYIEQNNIGFTDWEKAALTYHSGLPVEEMHSRLEELMKSTDEGALRQQVSRRLVIEREKLMVFHTAISAQSFWNAMRLKRKMKTMTS